MKRADVYGRFWATHFIDGEINACIWNDSDDVWHIASVEALDALCSVDFTRTVPDSCVLASLPQG